MFFKCSRPKTNSEVSPLFLAYGSEDIEMFRQLIDEGEIVNCLDINNCSLLSVIMSESIYKPGNKKFFDELLKANVHLGVIGLEELPLSIAIKNLDDIYYMNALLEHNACPNSLKERPDERFVVKENPGIFMAIQKGDWDKINLLLEHDIDLKISGKLSETVIMQLISNNSENKLEIAEKLLPILIERGANIEQQNDQKETSLHYFARYSNKNLMDLILTQDPNIDHVSILGKTPLIISCSWNNTEVAEALINKGANILIKDNTGMTAAMYISYFTNVKMLNLLHEKGDDFSSCDLNGDNVFHHIAYKIIGLNNLRNNEFADLFNKNKKLLFVENNEGKTPLKIIKSSDLKKYNEICKIINIDEKSL